MTLPSGGEREGRPSGGEREVGPHDRPTAAELVEAVREFLERDVLAATEGRVQFHTRVAVNVLAMVTRELEGADAVSAEHAARLRTLGVIDETELAAAIRAGDFDDRYAEVKAVVRASVLDKVRVANPDYLEAEDR